MGTYIEVYLLEGSHKIYHTLGVVTRERLEVLAKKQGIGFYRVIVNGKEIPDSSHYRPTKCGNIDILETHWNFKLSKLPKEFT